MVRSTADGVWAGSMELPELAQSCVAATPRPLAAACSGVRRTRPGWRCLSLRHRSGKPTPIGKRLDARGRNRPILCERTCGGRHARRTPDLFRNQPEGRAGSAGRGARRTPRGQRRGDGDGGAGGRGAGRCSGSSGPNSGPRVRSCWSARPTGWQLKDPQAWPAVLAIVFAFNFASSACYILNDLRDAEQDRLHPQPQTPDRPGEVSASAARRLSRALPALQGVRAGGSLSRPRCERALSVNMDPRVVAGGLGAACVLLYVLNVVLYTVHFKLRWCSTCCRSRWASCCACWAGARRCWSASVAAQLHAVHLDVPGVGQSFLGERRTMGDGRERARRADLLHRRPSACWS